MRLILIRHGQTPSNVLGLLDTMVPGPGLTDLGMEQAEGVVEALAGVDIHRVVASPQTRAQLTAKPLAADRGLDVEVLDGLREIAAGAWEMAGDEESVRGYIGQLGRWMTGNALHESTPGPTGESGADVLARYDGALAMAFEDDATRTVAAVSHGAAIRFWASVRGANLPDAYGLEHSVSNTGVVVLSRNTFDEPWSVESWTGDPIGGDELDDFAGDGPAADELKDRSLLGDPTGGE
ncbi:histidine phosphatase family protein [Nakamurella lactea]|uniref:histidine phosphatase family protein n=1 Tax=Nakamurella lactea TaxID=459515 RepID=UPI000406C095|nr:histidine phosphatase family protein [Nakamurella lactea]